MARKETPINFLAAYVKFAQNAVESKDEFHYACGIAAMSAAVGNRVYLDTPLKKYYGDLWFLMVGPAGISRKTTAVKCMDRVLPTSFHRYPQDWTWEGFVEELSEKDTGLWVRDEFAGWLSQNQKSYMAGNTDKLRRLYDNGTITSRTKGGGSTKVDNIAISVLLGSTPGAIAKYMNVIEELENGLLSRIMLISGKDIQFKGLWPITSNLNKVRQKLSNKLLWIRKRAQAAKKVIFEPADEEAIKEAYNDFFFRLLDKIGEDKRMASVYQRMLDVAFKIGLLFALDEKRTLSPVQTLKMSHAKDAIHLTESLLIPWYERALEEIKASYSSVESDKFEMEETKILKLMKRHGETVGKTTIMLRSKLYKYSNMGSLPRFDDRIKSMFEAQTLYPVGKTGHRGIYYAYNSSGSEVIPAGFYAMELLAIDEDLMP